MPQHNRQGFLVVEVQKPRQEPVVAVTTQLTIALRFEQYPGSEDKYEGEWVNCRASYNWRSLSYSAICISRLSGGFCMG